MLGFYTFVGPWIISVSQPLTNEINQGQRYVKRNADQPEIWNPNPAL